MPRPRRLLFEGAFYHVYNRGVEKRPIVWNDRDRRTFLHLLGETAEQFRIRLIAHCLMDNHFHFFLQDTSANLDSAMQNLQSQYAHSVNLRYGRVGPLFQGRYKSRLVEAERYAFALARYIHRNPIEAGLVVSAEDYFWSSYPSYTGLLPKWKWLDTEWLLAQFHPDPSQALRLFKAFHLLHPQEHEVKILENLRRPLIGPSFKLQFKKVLTKRGQTPFVFSRRWSHG